MDSAMMTQGLRIRPELPTWTPGRVLMWGVCLLPSLWFALFGTLVLRAVLLMGHLPTYGNPDPKDLGFPPHLTATLIAFLASFVAPFGIAILVMLRKPLNLHGARGPIILFLVTFAVLLLFTLTIGRPLVEWWMD